MNLRDDNDRLRDGDLGLDAFADAVPIAPELSTAEASILWRPFPLSCLPSPCREFVVEAAEALSCDPAYVALPHLAALGGCIGNRRGIQLKPGWVEPPVIWTAVVARSGTLKSPAQQLALDPLFREEVAVLEAYNDELKKHDRRLSAWHAEPAKQRGLQPQPPDSPSRLLVSEATIEAIASRLEENPQGLILARDELAGWLRSFDMYRGGRGGDAQKWIEMFGARTLIVDRKSGDKTTICVERAAVSVTGGIQPGVLRSVMAKEHFGSGLAARLLMSMPPSRPKRWTEAVVSAKLADSIVALYRDLRALEPGMGADGRMAPIDIPLSPDAQSLWIEFYNDHAGCLANAPDDDVAASLAKTEGYAARFSLLFHAVRDRERVGERVGLVDAESVMGGVELARWFAHEQQRVYRKIRADGRDHAALSVVDMIESKGGRITPRGLMHASRAFRGAAQDARAALQSLVEKGLGRWEKRPSGPNGGQPTEEFVLLGVHGGERP